jgi:hypothetical protein
MNTSLNDLSDRIRREADALLFEKGLMDVLSNFGTPHVSGSYALDLMTWRDLDIYLQAEDLSTIDFFELGSRVCKVLNPVKMSFRNELIAKTPGLPAGLYWGIYLGNERAGAWKIDVWAVEAPEYTRLHEFCNNIKQALTPETRTLVLGIKSVCWQDPDYRRSYTSIDIYEAVLYNNITDLASFKKYLEMKAADK